MKVKKFKKLLNDDLNNIEETIIQNMTRIVADSEDVQYKEVLLQSLVEFRNNLDQVRSFDMRVDDSFFSEKGI